MRITAAPDDRSVPAFAVKAGVFDAPLRGFGP
jgi:hypothetical protein